MLRTVCIIAIASPLLGLAPAPALAQEDARQWSERGQVSAYSMHGPWRPGPRLETARAGLAAVVHDGVIYAAGGAGLVEPRNDFEALEPEDGAWRARAAAAGVGALRHGCRGRADLGGRGLLV